MRFSIASAAILATGAAATYNYTDYTTEVVTEYTTYCPGPTMITHGTETYTVTSETTLTITNCPCTVTYPVTSAPPTYVPPPPTTSYAPPPTTYVPPPYTNSTTYIPPPPTTAPSQPPVYTPTGSPVPTAAANMSSLPPVPASPPSSASSLTSSKRVDRWFDLRDGWFVNHGFSLAVMGAGLPRAAS